MLTNLMSNVLDFFNVILYTLLNIRRDLVALYILKKVKRKIRYIDEKNCSVSEYYSKWFREQPKKKCIVYNDTTWTFEDVRIRRK